MKRKCEIDCGGAGMKEIKRPDIDCAAFKVDTRGCGRFNYHCLMSIANCRLRLSQVTISTVRLQINNSADLKLAIYTDQSASLLGFLLIAAALVFERDVLLYFLFEILKLFTGRMFELLESFGVGLFHLR